MESFMQKYIIAIFLLFSFLEIKAQSNVNPDISLIGTFNTTTNLTPGLPEKGKINFEMPEMELFVDGYLNPYAKAAGNISYEGGEFSVEELYADIVRGLPLDTQIKAGKYLVGFGQLNIVHPHAWSFVGRPLFHQVYFSHDGFNDIGFNFSFILPTSSFYSNLDLGIFKGDAIGGSEITDPTQESIVNHRGRSPIFVGRLGTFFSISDYSNLGVGLNGSYGVHAKMDIDPMGDTTAALMNKSLTYTYIGLDFKYKYRPDDYTVLTIQGESILNHRDVMRDGNIGSNSPIQNIQSINTYGAFLYIDYLFDKMYSFGAKYDYTNGIVDDEPAYNTLSNDDQNSTQGLTAWFGFYPIEHTLAFRLNVEHLFYHYDDGTSRDSSTLITLQMMFSLGPHKAHPF
jgi:hypothetical protein